MNRLAGRWGSLVIAAFQREVMNCRCLPPNSKTRPLQPHTWSSSKSINASRGICWRRELNGGCDRWRGVWQKARLPWTTT